MKSDFRMILTVSAKVLAISVLVLVLNLAFRDSITYGQSSEKTISGFRMYENGDYAIKIQYPNSWTKSEQDLAANVIVQFDAPEKKDIAEPAGMSISNFQMPANSSLADFVNFFFKERYEKPSDYKLISSSNTSLADKQAKQFVMYDYEKNILGISSTHKVMRLLTFDDVTSNGYGIKYWAEPSMFDNYLPTAQKMIESFIINHDTLPTQMSTNITKSPNQINANEIPSNLSSHPTQISNFTTETQEIKSENSLNNIGLSNLPRFLTVIADSSDTDFPLGMVIGPNSSIQTETTGDTPSSTIDLREYTPKFTFQFIEGSSAGLQVVKSVLIGQIKSYDSIEDALTNAKLWRNIPLNEQTVLRLDHQGLNFMIVEVDFTNSLFGLYAGVFDMQTPLDKGFYNDQLRDDLRKDKSLQVATTSEHNTKKELYWDAVKPLVCNSLHSFGFKVCKNN